MELLKKIVDTTPDVLPTGASRLRKSRYNKTVFLNVGIHNCTKKDFTINPQTQFFFSIIAGLMIVFAIWHSRLWWLSLLDFKQKSVNLSQRTSVFIGRQHRRRIQMSVLIGLSGVFMILGIHLSPRNHIAMFILSWFFTVGFLFWTILLAAIDVISISLFYSPSRRRNAAEQAEIRGMLEHNAKEELERLQKEKQARDVSAGELTENHDHISDQ
jgi:hypothetical protein